MESQLNFFMDQVIRVNSVIYPATNRPILSHLTQLTQDHMVGSRRLPSVRLARLKLIFYIFHFQNDRPTTSELLVYIFLEVQTLVWLDRARICLNPS